MTQRDFVSEAKSYLVPALSHLKYSQKKVALMSAEVTKLNEEELETWESFVARFGRVADLFFNQYLRAIALSEDPGFRGTFRDLLNLAEKRFLISDAKTWLRIRELRNISVHEYRPQNLEAILIEVRELTPHLVGLETKL